MGDVLSSKYKEHLAVNVLHNDAEVAPVIRDILGDDPCLSGLEDSSMNEEEEEEEEEEDQLEEQEEHLAEEEEQLKAKDQLKREEDQLEEEEEQLEEEEQQLEEEEQQLEEMERTLLEDRMKEAGKIEADIGQGGLSEASIRDPSTSELLYSTDLFSFNLLISELLACPFELF